MSMLDMFKKENGDPRPAVVVVLWILWCVILICWFIFILPDDMEITEQSVLALPLRLPNAATTATVIAAMPQILGVAGLFAAAVMEENSVSQGVFAILGILAMVLDIILDISSIKMPGETIFSTSGIWSMVIVIGWYTMFSEFMAAFCLVQIVETFRNMNAALGELFSGKLSRGGSRSGSSRPTHTRSGPSAFSNSDD